LCFIHLFPAGIACIVFFSLPVPLCNYMCSQTHHVDHENMGLKLFLNAVAVSKVENVQYSFLCCFCVSSNTATQRIFTRRKTEIYSITQCLQCDYNMLSRNLSSFHHLSTRIKFQFQQYRALRLLSKTALLFAVYESC